MGLFINSKGFSLIEMVVVMGLLAIASMGAMQVMVKTTKTTKTSEIGLEVNGIMNSITQNLLSSDGCTNTFKDLGPIPDPNSTMIALDPFEVDSIKNRASKAIFDKSKKYGNNRLKIDSMILDQVSIKEPQPGVTKKYGEFRLQIKLEKQGKNFYGPKIITKSIPIQAEFDLNNNLIKCYSATEDAVFTAKKESCEDIGGTWNITADTCELSDEVGKGTAASTERVEGLINELRDEIRAEMASYVLKAGDTMTGNLQVNAQIGSNNKIESATQICVAGRCRNFNQALCPQGKVVAKINTDGSVVCSNVTCPNQSTFFVGTDENGNPICKPFPTKTCSANQYVSRVYTDGTVQCTNLPPDTNKTCPAGTAIRRILSSGSVTCVTLPNNTNVFGKTCLPGKILRGFNIFGSPLCDSPNFDVKLASAVYSPTYNGGTAYSTCPSGYKIVGCLGKGGSYFGRWPTNSEVSYGYLWETGQRNEKMYSQGWYHEFGSNRCRARSYTMPGVNGGTQFSKSYVRAICLKFSSFSFFP